MQRVKDDNGWTEWHGGDCPVERGTLVDVRYRDGRVESAMPAAENVQAGYDAGHFFWRNDGRHNDIIAYRLHKQEETSTMTTIDNLKAKRQARDGAETAYQYALRAVREELGDGFTLEDNAAQACAERDMPPEEWREGDWVECVSKDEGDPVEVGGVYRVARGFNGITVRIKIDGRTIGDGCWSMTGDELRFHHRPA